MRDWAGILVSIGCVLSGIICITVISLYKEKVKDEVRQLSQMGVGRAQITLMGSQVNQGPSVPPHCPMTRHYKVCD